MSILVNFLYDEKASYEVNFNRWHHANTVEREIYKDVKLSLDEARLKFRKMYGYKRLNDSVFISGTNAMN